MSALLVLMAALLGSASAGGLRGNCCEGQGIIAGHVMGIMFGIVFGEGVAAFLRGWIPDAFRPASALFNQRILFSCLLDVGYVLISLLSTDDLSDSEENAYYVFIALNLGVVLFLILYWGFRKQNIFLGGHAEKKRRQELETLLAKARTTMTGHKLINESLRSDVESFNAVLNKKYRMTKHLKIQVLLFRAVVIAFLVHQYVNLCEFTLCSFYKQLAVVLSISSLILGFEDAYILKTHKAETINLHANTTGQSGFKMAYMEPVEAYGSVRDLLKEIGMGAKSCVTELAQEAAFEQMSVVRYGWNQNPAEDPRIDTSMWLAAYSMSLLQDARHGIPVSVAAIHVINSATTMVEEELVKPDPSAAVFLRCLSLIQQVGVPLLSEDARRKFIDGVTSWAKTARTHHNARRYSLGVLYDVFIPSEFKEETRPEEEDLDEALEDYLNMELIDLQDRGDISIRDDCLVEWISIMASHLKNTTLKGHSDVGAVSQQLEAITHQMIQSKLMKVGEKLSKFKSAVAAAPDGGISALVTQFKQDLSAISDEETPALEGDNKNEVYPAITFDRIPADLVRYGKPETILPLSIDAMVALFGDHVDLRPFGKENARLLTTVGFHGQAGPTKDAKSLFNRFKSKKEGKTASDKARRKSNRVANVRAREVKLTLPTREALKDLFLDNVFMFLFWSAWWIICIRSLVRLGSGNEASMDKLTFLGLPPTYDLETVPVQRFTTPLTYGVMHGNLLFLTFLPLTMSRWTIRQLSRFELISRVLRIEHFYKFHRRCGYNIFWGVLVGGCFWWIGVHYACTEHNLENACNGFYPKGNYVDIYNNLAAVTFLRELVVTTTLIMLLTSSLIFPHSLGRSTPFLKLNKAYEIFYYAHVLGFVAIAILAFSSRFEVFYPTLGPWCWYVMDVCVMFVFNTRPTIVAGAVCFSGNNKLKPALFLKLKKPAEFRYEAGQTAFIKIPKVSKLEWHPFSIASSPFDDYVEFLIDCGHGPKTWTKKLFDTCANARNPDKYGHTIALKPLSEHDKKANSKQRNLSVYLYGPCGSSFQAFDEHAGAILIGGGSGLPSSLSVLRHVFHLKTRNKSSKLKRVHFVWSTREFESLMWCWGHLKDCIERQCGYNKLGGRWTAENDEALENLDWLDITINSTLMDRESLARLIEIERDSAVGRYLIKRLKGGRITNWAEIFTNFESLVQSDDIKAFFCGPSTLAKALRQEAKKITSFKIEVSSENFHDN